VIYHCHCCCEIHMDFWNVLPSYPTISYPHYYFLWHHWQVNIFTERYLKIYLMFFVQQGLSARRNRKAVEERWPCEVWMFLIIEICCHCRYITPFQDSLTTLNSCEVKIQMVLGIIIIIITKSYLCGLQKGSTAVIIFLSTLSSQVVKSSRTALLLWVWDVVGFPPTAVRVSIFGMPGET